MNTKPSSRNPHTFKTIFQAYMAGKTRLVPYQQAGIILLTVVFAGFFGWVYEFIFYFYACPQIISVLPRPFMLFYSFRLLDANSSYSRSSTSTCKTEHSFCLNYLYKFTSTFCRVLVKRASWKIDVRVVRKASSRRWWFPMPSFMV